MRTATNRNRMARRDDAPIGQAQQGLGQSVELEGAEVSLYPSMPWLALG